MNAARGVTVNFSAALVTETCCHDGCGILFAVPADWQKHRREDHKWWYCPNGHRQHYTGETEEQKRLKQLERDRDFYKNRLASTEHQREVAQRSLAATKGVLTRKKKELARTQARIANGVCPCCNRTFTNLARHMKGKHPNYAAPEGGE